MVFFFVSLFLFVDYIQTDVFKVPQLPIDALLHPYTGRPVCAFFKHSATPLYCEEQLSKFLKCGIAWKFAAWTIGSVNLEDIQLVSPPPFLYPNMVPSIQCDVGLSAPLAFIFHKNNPQSLKKWFQFVARKHLKNPKIGSLSSLENTILDNKRGITMLSLPGMDYFHYMEEMLLKGTAVQAFNVVSQDGTKLNKMFTNKCTAAQTKLEKMYKTFAETVPFKVNKKQIRCPLEILISRSGSENNRELVEHFGVKRYPTVLFFRYEVWVMKRTFVSKLQGLNDVQPRSIQLTLNIVNINPAFLAEASFRHEILDTKYQLSPKLVCVFSYSNPKSLEYILRFEEIRKQLECEGSALEYRYINATSIKTFPVFVLFWQERTPTHEIVSRQEVFDGLPSTSEVHSFLVQKGILDEVDSAGKCFSEEDEHSLECVNPSHSRGKCETNLTVVRGVSTKYYLVSSGLKVEKQKIQRVWNSKAYSRRKKTGNLTVLTDDEWSAVIESSVHRTETLSVRDDISPVLSLVVFVIKNCRYCRMVLPSLEKLAENVRHIERATMYLVNCSSSPAICTRYNVQGYPSIKLFRSIPWFEVAGCPTDQSNKQHIVQDFHGPFEPLNLVLEWLSSSSLPVVKKDFLIEEVPSSLDHDVYLVGIVITRSLAFRFFPASTHGKLYSMKCFQTACELLFGRAVCYMTLTRDLGIKPDMATTKSKDLFLVKLTLFRRDGIQTRIFELGVPLHTAMISDKGSQLHKFHNTHRYNLPTEFRCEDNHALCTEFIVKYVTDHSRLPVTRLSHTGFHIINRFSSEGDRAAVNVPVVVVLAHPQNMTSNSSYFQKVTKAAYMLYRHAIFTALDVDEYPWWASRFVPKEYDFNRFSDSFNHIAVPPLYHYPRICIVMATDHQQAAFLPSFKAMANAKDVPTLLRNVTAEDIVKFVESYLLHPEDMLVKTLEF